MESNKETNLQKIREATELLLLVPFSVIEDIPFFHQGQKTFQYQLERDYKKYKFAVDNQYTILYLFDGLKLLLDKPEFNGIYENKEHIFNSFNGLENWLKNIKNNKQVLYN